ncbi:N-acetyltransferase GCN5 [Candidatus Magnetobacterium bavaricum]|uniref:N-acetyltransferase GCN5 n=1 Tax=Candidatus Magnetobacterium bavaricum TaxID=29290 RepID=A0A0F3GK06_9BACT|nr:N-acetyltransferase GCN5 [Candidatus Magnetobacterium bavaricum]
MDISQGSVQEAEMVCRRKIRDGDREGVRRILAATGVFHPREIDVAEELVIDALEKGAESEYLFIFADVDGVTVGYICYGAISMTEAGFDLYWIATDPSFYNRDIATTLLREAEGHIVTLGGRYIFVETSSKAQYLPARGFYKKRGYVEVARVPNYYADGDGKVIMMTTLNVQRST